MWEILHALVFLLIAVVIIGWNLWWSPMARSTNEVAYLNKIWEDFNDNKVTAEETYILLKAKQWRYHEDKAELLEIFLKVELDT